MELKLLIKFDTLEEMKSFMSFNSSGNGVTQGETVVSAPPHAQIEEKEEAPVVIKDSEKDTKVLPNLFILQCDFCSKEFTTDNPDAKLCSKECGKKSYMREYWRTHRKVNGKIVLKEDRVKEVLEKCKKTKVLPCTKQERPTTYHE